MNGLFSKIYRMSSFPLTNSYFSMWLKPPSSYSIWSSHDFTIEKWGFHQYWRWVWLKMGKLPTTCGDLNREHDENIVDAKGMGQNHISLIYFLTLSWPKSYYMRFKYTTAMGHYIVSCFMEVGYNQPTTWTWTFYGKTHQTNQNKINGLSSLTILFILTYGCIFHLRQGSHL